MWLICTPLPTIKLLWYMEHCILVQVSKTCYFSFCHPYVYTLKHFSLKSSTTPLNWIFKIPKFWTTPRHVCESWSIFGIGIVLIKCQLRVNCCHEEQSHYYVMSCFLM
jgi:hypothetical protein